MLVTTLHGDVTVAPEIPLTDLRRGDLVLGAPVAGQPRTVYRIVAEYGSHPTPGVHGAPDGPQVDNAVLVAVYGAGDQPTGLFDAASGPWNPDGLKGLDRIVGGLV